MERGIMNVFTVKKFNVIAPMCMSHCLCTVVRMFSKRPFFNGNWARMLSWMLFETLKKVVLIGQHGGFCNQWDPCLVLSRFSVISTVIAGCGERGGSRRSTDSCWGKENARSVSQEGGKNGEDTVKESSHLHYPATLLVTQRITFTQRCASSTVIPHKSLTTEWNINKAVSYLLTVPKCFSKRGANIALSFLQMGPLRCLLE